jgi:superfamily I DNA and/or RNA helicase
MNRSSSQVRLPEASVPLTLRRTTGRLLLAGDHQQLPPIVHGEWPNPASGPVIHDSVLVALRVAGDASLGLQLQENWRMNRTLTGLAAEFIYGPDYRCANEDIATHRLRWSAPEGSTTLARYALDPDFPFVIVVLDGVEAGKENVIEAELVAELARALRDGLRLAAGGVYPDDSSFFHGTKKEDPGAFIVSPHHVQIAAIRKSLAACGLTNPFVDTVEKMQGQQAEAVLVSYGVSDPEVARHPVDPMRKRKLDGRRPQLRRLRRPPWPRQTPPRDPPPH